MPVASIKENRYFVLGEKTFDLLKGHLLQGDNAAAARQQTLALDDIVAKNHIEMENAIAKAKGCLKDGGQVMTHKFLEISHCLRPFVNVGVTSLSHDGCGDGGKEGCRGDGNGGVAVQ